MIERWMPVAALLAMLGCEVSVTTSSTRTVKTTPAASAPSPTDEKTPTAPALTWVAFAAPESGFAARFPADPRTDVIDDPDPAEATGVAYTGHAPGRLFANVLVTTFSEQRLTQSDPKTLIDTGLAAESEGAEPGTLESSEIRMAGHPARRAVFVGVQNRQRLRVEVRVLFVAPRLYQLRTVSPQGAPDDAAAKFFDSFTLSDGPSDPGTAG